MQELPSGWQRVTLPQAELGIASGYLSPEQTDRLSRELQALKWHQPQVQLFGKTHPTPRLVAFQADAGVSYSYSGVHHGAAPEASWAPNVRDLRDRLCRDTGVVFNSVLLNRYRDGADHMGWHADNEPALGNAPVVASVSVGATRSFQLKHRTLGLKYHIELADGDLLWMAGSMQTHWVHALPKRLRVREERFNLTFRVIYPEACL